MKPKSKGKKDESDPSWSRSVSKSKKKLKMGSRTATRRLWNAMLKRKAMAHKMLGEPTCVTRTVELSGNENVGNESSKLLFVIALGLTPKVDKISSNFPVVKIEKMDPNVESEAKARTRDVIFRIFRQRKRQQLLDRIEKPLSPSPMEQPELNVEIVNLVSSDDDSTSTDGEPVVALETSARNDIASRSRVNGLSSVSRQSSSNNRVVARNAFPLRTPVFKILANNQESQSGIFRNWKPESMTSLMNKKTSESTARVPANSNVVKSESKFLSSLKSVPKSSTLTINNFNSKAPSHKTQVHGLAVETPSIVPEFILPDKQPIITID
ncbi:unnamed protein product [Orchesella dallaii]|uniref:Uncharacterized protein n=1 Tax=Orchesella dallaii TaxID=48710 RepID=A0ABP1RDN4_9HEXA